MAVLPSWYIDLTGGHSLLIRRLQMPVINGAVNVRLQPRHPGQVLAAGLVMATYPLLLFVSVFGPIIGLVRSMLRSLIHISGLQLPRRCPDPVTYEASAERVSQSVERVGKMLSERLHMLDEPALRNGTSTLRERGRTDCR